MANRAVLGILTQFNRLFFKPLILFSCLFPFIAGVSYGTNVQTGKATAPRTVPYGIPCDPALIYKDTIKQNQNLAKILQAHSVPYSIIDEAARKSKKVFDVRRFRAGNPYAIIRNSDSEKGARYFVYEQDAVNYVVYDLGNPVQVYTGEKPIGTKTRQASGVIRSSLSQTLSRVGLNYEHELVDRLSDVFAWTIDFHHLAKGDHFKFIYEENFVDGESVGLGNILAAYFNHRGEDYYGFYYEQNGWGMYYDEKGNSLEKTFLKAPVRYSRITSRPSKRRLHPILKTYRPHLGTDYAAPTGTPIHSIGDGVISKKGRTRGFGRYVSIKHRGGFKTQYLHMSRFAKRIKPGRSVKRGEIIGYVGRSGLATGPHLCFRFWKNRRIFNHLKAKLPSGEPLARSYLSEYRVYAQQLKTRLDNIALHETINLAKK